MSSSGKEAQGGGFDSGGAMWGGRFEEKVSNVVERFGESVSFDRKLYKQVNLFMDLNDDRLSTFHCK